MKKLLLFILLTLSNLSFAQKDTEILKKLSLEKWHWMADKNIEKLDELFHPQSKYVHMSGTWKKQEELDIIKSGSIWYKNAKVHDTAVEIDKNVGIVWNRITLDAVVRENVAVNEFTVTEIYQKTKKGWKLMALTFSSVRDTHKIIH